MYLTTLFKLVISIEFGYVMDVLINVNIAEFANATFPDLRAF